MTSRATVPDDPVRGHTEDGILLSESEYGGQKAAAHKLFRRVATLMSKYTGG